MQLPAPTDSTLRAAARRLCSPNPHTGSSGELSALTDTLTLHGRTHVPSVETPVWMPDQSPAES